MSKLINKNMIKNAFQRWKSSTLATQLSNRGLRKKKFCTSSANCFEDITLPHQLSEEEWIEQIGFPGEFPFTRGVHASMYRGRLWTMRQYAGFGTAQETNRRYRLLLENGTSGLSVAFDLPTQMGRNSNHPLANGEVGRVGVAIDTLEDMNCLFQDIPLKEVSTSMTINATAHILLAMYVAVAKSQGVALEKIKGTTQNDILKEYIARGTFIYPPKQSLKITADIFEYCKDNLPSWNTISVSGYHIREAGSTAVQEVAFTLANGLAYLEAAKTRGLSVDDVAPRMTFFFNSHNNFLEEVAKFRAARRLWAKLVKQRFSPANLKSLKLRFHTQTAGSTLTAQQPMVNLARTTTQALAAVLGGTQSLHTNAWDEALGLPSEEAALTALRTQQYIALESGLDAVVDPLAGSYVIEELTSEIENKALNYIEKIDSLGGMVQAVEQEFPQQEIEESAYIYQKEIESKDKKIVGINCFEQCSTNKNKTASPQQSDPKLEQKQKERLAKILAQRDSLQVKKALTELRLVAEQDSNIIPAVLKAVEGQASLGEISDVLRDTYGEYS